MARLLVMSLVMTAAVSAVPLAARADPTPATVTPVDLGANVAPVAGAEPVLVNGSVEVPVEVYSTSTGSYTDGIWQQGRDGTGQVITPMAPGDHPTSSFLAAAINSSGVEVGYVGIPPVNGAAAFLPAYWDSKHSMSFTVLDISGLSVNGQQARSGQFFDIDAAGDMVGPVDNHSNTGGGFDNDAGLELPGAGGLPGGSPEVVSALDGTNIIELDRINTGFEASADHSQRQDVVNRTTGSLEATDIIYRAALSSSGALAGSNVNGDPTLRVSGTDTPLRTPSGCGYSTVLSIEASASSVGTALQCGGSTTEALSWDATGAVTPLRSRLAPDSGWTLKSAAAIDDGGDIVGAGTFDGAAHGYLLPGMTTKVPPVVNSTGDTPAKIPSGGSCDTGQTVMDASGDTVAECTLRAAIEAENSGVATSTTITFDLPAAAGKTISPASPLPAVTAAGVTVDGSAGTSAPAVTLDGSKLGGAAQHAALLHLSAGKDTVTDLAFSQYASTGILIDAADGADMVTGALIGGGDRGVVSTGIDVEGSPKAVIGGTTAAARNTIAGADDAILVQGSGSSGAVVTGNWIGTGSAVSDPVHEGISVIDASGARIGGPTGTAGQGAGNVVIGSTPAGAVTTGVFIAGNAAQVTGTVVEGNLIGVEPDGTSLPSSADGSDAFSVGVSVSGMTSANAIGGAAPGQGNVISGASGEEVSVNGTLTYGASVTGNLIGTDITGLHPLPGASTTTIGVAVLGASGTTVGSVGSGRNVIAGQPGAGVATLPRSQPGSVDGGKTTEPGTDNVTVTAPMNTTIAGDLIGPAADGSTVSADAIQQDGILLAGTGETVGPGNTIDLNGKGVLVTGTSETVFGNHVGVDDAGSSARPNGDGVVVNPPAGTDVGSDRIGVPGRARNVISGNLYDLVVGRPATVAANLVGTVANGLSALPRFPNPASLPADVVAGAEYAAYGPGIYAPTGGALIGGTAPGAGNTVGGLAGIAIAAGPGSVVQGNTIGVGVDGTSPVPNGGPGIAALANVTVGAAPPGGTASTAAAGGNVIAHNQAAVSVNAGATGVTVLSNSIHDNTAGITLGAGSNDGLASPGLGGAEQDGTGHTALAVTTAVAGTLQVYTTTCGPGVAPQGTSLLTTVGVAPGNATIELPVQPVGAGIDATITTAAGTSAFSACTTVGARPVIPGVTNPNPTQGGNDTVAGSGFTPGEPVTVTLHSTPVLLTTVTADQAGTATAAVTIPANTLPGSHELILTGSRSGHTVSYPITVEAAARLGLLHLTSPKTLLGATLTGRRKLAVAGHAGVPAHGAAAAAVLITTTAPISVDGQRVTRSALLTLPISTLTVSATHRATVRITVFGYYTTAKGITGDSWHRTRAAALRTGRALSAYRAPAGSDALLVQVNTGSHALTVDGISIPAAPGSQLVLIRPSHGRISARLGKGQSITVLGHLGTLATGTDGTTRQPGTRRPAPLRSELN